MALDKESVTIAINRSTDSTPVFVAGTFSEPHWEPFELSAKPIPSSTEFVFSRDFEVSPGQYHYHFREGAGGAWFHDDAAKNVSGDHGQVNLLNVGLDFTAAPATHHDESNGANGTSENSAAAEPTEVDGNGTEKESVEPTENHTAEKPQENGVAEKSSDVPAVPESAKGTDTTDVPETNGTEMEPSRDETAAKDSETEPTSNGTAEAAQEPATDAVPETAEESTTEPATNGLVGEETEKPTDEPAKESAEESIKESSETPAVDEAAAKPADAPADAPADVAPAEEPKELVIEEFMKEPEADKPKAEETPAEEPTKESTEETSREPAEEPVKEAQIEEATAEEPAKESAADEAPKEIVIEEFAAAAEEPSAPEEPVKDTLVEEPTVEAEKPTAAEETPAEEKTSTETPAAEEAKVEEPTTEEPAAEEPAKEEQKPDGAPVEDKTEAVPEPAVGETVTAEEKHEPASEEPVATESVKEEPATEAPAEEKQETAAEQVPEPVKEESAEAPAEEKPEVAPEPAVEEPTAEAAKEEPVTEKPAEDKQETATDPATEAPVTEQSTVTEAAKEEPAEAKPEAVPESTVEEPAATEESKEDIVTEAPAEDKHEEPASKEPATTEAAKEEPATEEKQETVAEPATEAPAEDKQEPVPEAAEETTEKSAEGPVAEATPEAPAEEPVKEDAQPHEEETSKDSKVLAAGAAAGAAVAAGAAASEVAEEQAVAESSTEEPAADKEEPVTETPAVEEPASKEPTAEEPVSKEPVAEDSTSNEPAVEEPTAAETPAPEEPAVEVSTTESAEPQKEEVHEHASEEPAKESAPEPVAEKQGPEEPVAAAPVEKTVEPEQPAADNKPVDEPAVTEQKEEPAVESTPAQEAAEEPVAEAKSVEEPTKEEPAVAEPVTEAEPAEGASEPVPEEKTSEETAAQEPEPTTAEVPTEAPPAEEVSKEDGVTAEPAPAVADASEEASKEPVQTDSQPIEERAAPEEQEPVSSKPAEQDAQPQEEEANKDSSILTPEVIGAGVGATAVAAGAAAAGVALSHRASAPENKDNKAGVQTDDKNETAHVAAESKPADGKQNAALAQEQPTPEPEADAAVVAPADHDETPVQKSEQVPANVHESKAAGQPAETATGNESSHEIETPAKPAESAEPVSTNNNTVSKTGEGDASTTNNRGNAWAIRKAPEKRQQQRLRHSSFDLGKATPREGPAMDSHNPITSRKSSPRLNYYYNKEEKIGPHISRVRGSSGPDPGCGCDRGQGRVDKQPSATVAKTTTGQGPQPIEQQHVEGEKKRSRAAALRSKFSLRDIGKRARKEKSSQEDDKLNGYDDNGNLGESFDNISQNDFDEGGLYIPKCRKSGVPDVYPQSGPACQTQTMTSLRNSLMSSHTDYVSCKSARVPSGSEEENLEMSRTKQENVNANTDTTQDDKTGKHVDALISREVSPARSGRYHNSGQGEIIKAQSSFCSLRAERDASTPDLLFHHGYRDGNSSMGKPSGNESASTRSRASRNERIFTDTTSTSHGGFAPPPPDPSYQNTITLEQQLFSHAQALHHHMNSVVGRITKTFEGSNSWTMDQILRNVEAMSDTARLLNSRSVSQSDHMINMQREMSDIRDQVNAAQVEVRRAEQRLQMMFRQEVGKLRRDLNILLLSSNGSMVDSRVLQGVQSVPDMKNQPRKDQVFKRKGVNNVAVAETNGKPGNFLSPSTPVKGSAHKNPAQESSGSPQSRAVKLDSSTTLDVASDNDQAPPEKTTVDDPNRNEEGSKTPHIKSIMLGLRRRREGCDSSYSSSSSRFLRTPRRNRNNGNKISSVFSRAEDFDLTKPVAASTSTPPVPPVPTTLAQSGNYSTDEQKSPSAIHPALRNARQQQIMREREQQCQIDYHQAISDNFL